MEGAAADRSVLLPSFGFLPTPSAWRATGWLSLPPDQDMISTHALRMEGDVLDIFNS